MSAAENTEEPEPAAASVEAHVAHRKKAQTMSRHLWTTLTLNDILNIYICCRQTKHKNCGESRDDDTKKVCDNCFGSEKQKHVCSGSGPNSVRKKCRNVPASECESLLQAFGIPAR
jgi:hypothetical protein